ncbi:PREDICTED: uncharacterized protein LOC109232592 [Nicotiana attenuata]|uniref:uncharacterized protein LOC109232592 n=1 Tax=Nicotiana attenuata TaxID=49451 RepID=UPI000905C99F|nr:PREDICTED: uncharacterized protein LOC109232592 [Nicotiana attenuata]
MPAYAKFLKEILTKKMKIEETSMVKITEHCSAILQNKLPQKCGDPGSFATPCSLGSINFDKSLCDSGASINLMPLSYYRNTKNKYGKIRSAPISLQLVDQTTIIPEGIVEDVLVRVKKLKEKAALTEKDKCGVYPKKAEKKLSIKVQRDEFNIIIG